jgi:hypothetical protein
MNSFLFRFYWILQPFLDYSLKPAGSFLVDGLEKSQAEKEFRGAGRLLEYRSAHTAFHFGDRIEEDVTQTKLKSYTLKEKLKGASIIDKLGEHEEIIEVSPLHVLGFLKDVRTGKIRTSASSPFLFFVRSSINGKLHAVDVRDSYNGWKIYTQGYQSVDSSDKIWHTRYHVVTGTL